MITITVDFVCPEPTGHQVVVATATAGFATAPPSFLGVSGVPIRRQERRRRSRSRCRRRRVVGGQTAQRRHGGVHAQPCVSHREPDTEKAPRRRDVPGGDRVVQRRAQQQRSARRRRRFAATARRTVQTQIDHHRRRRGRRRQQQQRRQQTRITQ